MKLGLCAGRHNMPGITNYVYPNTLDPLDYAGMLDRALEIVPENGHLDLYVTGLTAAALAVVRACAEKHCSINCWHYDRVTDTYKCQEIF